MIFSIVERIIYNNCRHTATFYDFNISSQLPVQVKKNPGLGFSIAGGVAGAETVRKIFILLANNLH